MGIAKQNNEHCTKLDLFHFACFNSSCVQISYFEKEMRAMSPIFDLPAWHARFSQLYSSTTPSRPKRSHKLFHKSLKRQQKLALLPPSKYTETLTFDHLGIQIKSLRSLKMSLRSERSNL